VDNRGVLIAAGLIAGEALMGLLFAALAFAEVRIPNFWQKLFGAKEPSYWVSVAVFLALGYLMVKLPVDNAGDPDEPAAPAVM